MNSHNSDSILEGSISIFMGAIFLLILGVFVFIKISEEKMKKKKNEKTLEKNLKDKEKSKKGKRSQGERENIDVKKYLKGTEPNRIGYDKEDLKGYKNPRFFEVVFFSKIDEKLYPKCNLGGKYFRMKIESFREKIEDKDSLCGRSHFDFKMNPWEIKRKQTRPPFRYRFLLGCDRINEPWFKETLGFGVTYNLHDMNTPQILKKPFSITTPEKEEVKVGEVFRKIIVFEPQNFTDYHRDEFLKNQLGHVPDKYFPERQPERFYLTLKNLPFPESDTLKIDYRYYNGASSHVSLEKQKNGIWKSEYRVRKGGVFMISKDFKWPRENRNIIDQLLFLVDDVKKKSIDFNWLQQNASIKRQSVKGTIDLDKFESISLQNKNNPRIRFFKYLRGKKMKVVFKQIYLRKEMVSLSLPEGRYNVEFAFLTEAKEEGIQYKESTIELSNNFQWPPE